MTGPRLTLADRADLGAGLRRRYESGVPIRTLADEAGRSYGWTHRTLADAGTVFRSRGGPRSGDVQSPR